VPVSSATEVVRFGLFELDLKAGDLSRGGTKIRLPQQPLQLLMALLERPGEVVSREELTRRLWSPDVFVDFEHGLNKSVQKLRDALGDSAESPRYIETIPRVGYRFIAPVSAGMVRVETDAEMGSASKAPAAPSVSHASEEMRKSGRRIAGWAWLVGVGGLVVVGVISGLYIYRRAHAVEPIRSMAVLPLENLSGDPGQDYFADGMTDELTTMLAKNSNLRVVSRTSVMQYKGARRPLPEIARALGVDGVLEGSVERVGDKVHMTVQLIAAPSDTHVWAESYDRDANDVVSLPGEVATSIAKRLNSVVERRAAQRYVSPEAHDAYMRGHYLWYLGKNEEAAGYFRKAIELQPDFALGWFGTSAYFGQGVLDGELDPRQAVPRGLAAAKKTVELDDSLPEGHLGVGALKFMDWKWAEADREIGRAIELNPEFAEAYHFRAKMYAVLGRTEEAIQSEKRADTLDPMQRPYALGLLYITIRRYDDAIADARSRLESTPQSSVFHWTLCDAYRRKGDLKAAAEEWIKASEMDGNKVEAAAVRQAYEKGGYDALLLRRVEEFNRRVTAKQYVSPTEFAREYAQLGRREEAMEKLEEAYRLRDPLLIWVQTEPAYDFLHGDARYQAIAKGMGLPETE
jgi:TolB-like protein/DNA-binding winged helix-turn-helix (wHTH) protein